MCFASSVRLRVPRVRASQSLLSIDEKSPCHSFARKKANGRRKVATSPDFNTCPLQLPTMRQRMDLSKGFQIEEPNVFVPWDTTEAQFQQTFERLHLRHMKHSYYTTRCTSLAGLSLHLMFVFYPMGLGELRFGGNSCPDLDTSYDVFQRHLEETFGPPTLTTPGSEGYLDHTWVFHGAEVRHYVSEHFGPAEYVIIQKTAERKQ